MSTFSDLTVPRIDQSGPPPDGEFTYIDISSIDNRLKRIVEPKRLPVGSAPSRARQRLQSGDVLVSMTRPNLNAVAIVTSDLKDAVGSTGFHVLRAVNGIEPRWLFYAVQTYAFVDAMSGLVQGALYPAVRPKDIGAFGIEAPPFVEQQRIVAEIEKQFSRLDEAVANLKRVKANLKRYKAAVLKAAVEGKLTEDWRKQHPDVEPASKLRERILAERREKWDGRGQYKGPSEVDMSQLPALANGWTWTTVEALTITGPQNGLYLPQPLYGAGIPILRIDDFQDGWSRVSDELQRVRASQTQVRTYCLDESDFVINRVNSPTHLGKALVVRQKHLPALFESNMMRLKLSTHVQTAFIAFYLQSIDGRRRLTKNAKWAVNQASINQTDVGMTELPLPPFEEQQCIVNEVERRLSVIEELETTVEANLKRADRLRQSVLGDAFSGKLVRATV